MTIFRKLVARKTSIYTNQVRCYLWLKDAKPGKTPITDEERKAAAIKYGILPAEYKHFPNDGNGLGDYPKLPDVSGDVRDPFYPWDNPELKRNYQEAVHAEEDLINEVRYDISAKHRVGLGRQIFQFCFAVFGLFGIFYYLEDKKMFPSVAPKQYPSQGTHYTFEMKK